MSHVYEVTTTVTVEAASAEDAEEGVWRFWQRACAALCQVTERGVLTALQAANVCETDDEPDLTGVELFDLEAIAFQIAFAASGALA